MDKKDQWRASFEELIGAIDNELKELDIAKQSWDKLANKLDKTQLPSTIK